jgi:hypothetical protein
MSLISKLTPTNLLEEKAKFLADPKYNPQFIYEEPVDSAVLTKYGLPQKKYKDLAQEILDKAYFGRNEQDLLMMEGPVLSQDEVTKKTAAFLKLHQLDRRYKIAWSSSYVSRTTIDSDTIKFRIPSIFRKNELLGMLYHEIGTHALRRINYEQQPWYQKKKKYGFIDYLKTEEGLASLHSLIPSSCKYAYDMADRYMAVVYAQQHSFSQLWQFIGKYIQDPDTRWMVTLRQKRGLTDTSQPGGFTKDLVYFEGLIEVWNYLKKNDFDPTNLYFGKIALEDIDLAKSLSQNFKPSLPVFYISNIENYKEQLIQIADQNNL